MQTCPVLAIAIAQSDGTSVAPSRPGLLEPRALCHPFSVLAGEDGRTVLPDSGKKASWETTATLFND